jgi:dienelactone hydrolase
MGGGVALRTASERQDVKAVVAVSPFVGWDTIIHWLLDRIPYIQTPVLLLQGTGDDFILWQTVQEMTRVPARTLWRISHQKHLYIQEIFDLTRIEAVIWFVRISLKGFLAASL